MISYSKIKIQAAFFFLLFLFLVKPSLANSLKGTQLDQINSWGYQLQNIIPSEIRKQKSDLIVIEPIQYSGQPRYLSSEEVLFMKNQNDPERRKILLAYISIGEAENYRFYWDEKWKKDPPSWLGTENPNWEGNFKVRFWNQTWKKIILKEIDNILKAGFDGVYLDIVDAFEYWADEDKYIQETLKKGDPKNNLSQAAELMVQWIHEIAQHSRVTSKWAQTDFLVFPQNGEDLIQFIPRKKLLSFWNSINGIGIEDLFHPGSLPENNPYNLRKKRLSFLHNFKEKGKIVLVIDYLTSKTLITPFCDQARRMGLIPFVSKRELHYFPEQKFQSKCDP